MSLDRRNVHDDICLKLRQFVRSVPDPVVRYVPPDEATFYLIWYEQDDLHYQRVVNDVHFIAMDIRNVVATASHEKE